MLWKWARRRHPKKASKWVKARYFLDDGWWTFRSEGYELVKPDKTPITRFKKVIGKSSPHDPSQGPYWAERRKEQVARETYSKQRLVLHKRQEFKCALCDIPFFPGESVQHSDHIISKWRGGSDKMANRRLVHPWCHRIHHQRTGYKGPRLEPDEG